MDNDLRRLAAQLGGDSDGSTVEQVREVEHTLGARFPDDYVTFMAATAGGEGPVGEGYARFYGVEELVRENSQYAAFEQFHGFAIFGTDGGGEAYCFDANGDVFVIGFVSSRDDNVRIGTFAEFVRRLASGRLLGSPTDYRLGRHAVVDSDESDSPTGDHA